MFEPKKGDIRVTEAHFVPTPVPTVTIKYAEWTESGKMQTEVECPINLMGEEEILNVAKFLEDLARKSKSVTK